MAPDFERRRRGREERKQLYGEIFDAAADVIFVHDPETGLVLDANEAALDLYGWTPEEMRGMSVLAFSAGDQEYREEAVHELLASASRQAYLRFEWHCVRKTGEMFWVDVGLKRVQIAGEERVIAVVRDITELKREETALRRSERRQALRSRIAETFLTVPDDEMYAALLPILLEASRSEAGVFGYLDELGDFVAPTMTSHFWEQCKVEEKRWVFERDTWGDSSWPRAIREKRIIHSNEPSRAIPEGHIAIRNHVSVPIIYREDVIGLFQVANKPTDYDEEDVALLQEIADAIAPTLRARLERDRQADARSVAELAIQQLLMRNEAILAAVPDIIMEVDNDRTYTWANEPGLAFFGPDVVGQEAAAYFVGDQDIYDQVQTIFNGSGDVVYVESWQQRIDGERRLLAWWCRVLRGPDGAVTGALSTARDITERRELEAQFRQAQKMEAVGQLAGGVAHDFNNILQTIVGYTDIAVRQTDEDDPNAPRLQRILRSAERAAALTKQLLAFSRRQVMKPRRIAVGELVTEVSRMLRRVLGEDIEVVLRICDEPAVVLADAAQLEQVLMNLCVNARDAMAGGGRLAIATEVVEVPESKTPAHESVSPGSYARIRVEDTGSGVHPDHLEHIFEPFFTTKPEGKGTGLGLSTAYGIVRQHEGFLDAASEPGRGTTISVYLPLVSESADVAASTGAPPVPHGGTETILVAEDDRMVREMLALILEDAGYTALQAADGVAAMELFDRKAAAIDLAILDVLMPRAGGREVYEHVHSARADLPVLFCSGYSAGAISDRFVLDAGMQLMQKPFPPDALLQRVRELLDGAAPAS